MVRTSMQELRLRPYHDLEGAIFRPEAGWLIPATYGPVDAEVRAVRTRAGMIDWSDRAKIRLTGPERVTFLDGIVTADMKVLTPGTSAYALLLNEKSRVLGDLRVYAFADSLVLDIEASQKDTIMAILEKARVSDDVEFHDLGACGHIEVHGPASGDLLTGVLPVDARGLPRRVPHLCRRQASRGPRRPGAGAQGNRLRDLVPGIESGGNLGRHLATGRDSNRPRFVRSPADRRRHPAVRDGDEGRHARPRGRAGLRTELHERVLRRAGGRGPRDVRGPGAPQAVRPASRRRRPTSPWGQGLERDPRSRQGNERHLVPDDRLGGRDRASPGGRGFRERNAVHRPRRLGPAGTASPAPVRCWLPVTSDAFEASKHESASASVGGLHSQRNRL